MTTPLAARLAEVLPYCLCECGRFNSRRESDGSCGPCGAEPVDLAPIVPAVLAFVEAELARERERCAMLHESVDPACDHERSKGDPGAGAMGSIIEYRDRIRALSAKGT